MTHLRVLAAPEMAGRDSPSPGLDAAAAYIANQARRHGLVAPVGEGPKASYLQTFSLWRRLGGTPGASSLGKERAGDGAEMSLPTHRLFEDGFYLDETLQNEDLQAIETQLPSVSDPTLIAPSPDERRAHIARHAAKAGEVSNVLALLPGTGPQADEVILVMAHYDHVGKRRGQVYPGADDNASGSSVLLSAIPELVRLQRAGKLNRSVLFLWTAAEEKGLVGSHYYSRHPLPGLGADEIVGVVNLDMVGRLGPNRLSVLDTTRGRPNYLGEILNESLGDLHEPFTDVRRDIEAFADRQDGATFSRMGEDVLMMFEGLTENGDLNPDYHRPSDTIENLEADGGARKMRKVRDLFLGVVRRAANRPASSKPDA